MQLKQRVSAARCFAVPRRPRKPHLLEHRPAGEAVRVGERLKQFEVAVGLPDQPFDGLPRGLDRRGARVWRWNSGVSQVPQATTSGVLRLPMYRPPDSFSTIASVKFT